MPASVMEALLNSMVDSGFDPLLRQTIDTFFKDKNYKMGFKVTPPSARTQNHHQPSIATTNKKGVGKGVSRGFKRAEEHHSGSRQGEKYSGAAG